MFNVGICDDCLEDRERLKQQLFQCFLLIGQEFRLFEYSRGEKLYSDLESNRETVIDLLFLDIEMSGMDGLALRDKLIRSRQVWRIVFVSNHQESVMEAFGLKTIGFISKPADIEQVRKKISYAVKEFNNDKVIELPSAQYGNKLYRIDDIAYFGAERNYSSVFLTDENDRITKHELICCKLIDVEQKCGSTCFIRTHRSYLINMGKIRCISNSAVMCDPSVQIPIGRKYREQVKDGFYDYIVGKARERE